MFYVGQKVICVDDDLEEADGRKRLFAGTIYTVREINVPSGPFSIQTPRFVGLPRIRLVEITDRFLVDTPYSSGRFRPIVERKTSIEVFTRLLNPSDERVSA